MIVKGFCIYKRPSFRLRRIEKYAGLQGKVGVLTYIECSKVWLRSKGVQNIVLQRNPWHTLDALVTNEEVLLRLYQDRELLANLNRKEVGALGGYVVGV